MTGLLYECSSKSSSDAESCLEQVRHCNQRPSRLETRLAGDVTAVVLVQLLPRLLA